MNLVATVFSGLAGVVCISWLGLTWQGACATIFCAAVITVVHEEYKRKHGG